jgi:hypothetical protein
VPSGAWRGDRHANQDLVVGREESREQLTLGALLLRREAFEFGFELLVETDGQRAHAGFLGDRA